MWEGRETSPYMRTPGWRNWGFLFVFVSYLKTDIFGDVCFLHVSGGFEKKKSVFQVQYTAQLRCNRNVAWHFKITCTFLSK